MLATPGDPAGLEYLERVKRLGFDYVELPLAELMLLEDAEFQALPGRLRALQLRCDVLNNFFPAGLRLTGAERDAGRIRAYLKRALPRAEALGADTIVFGSAKAKSVPEGFPMDAAWKQVEEDISIIAEELGDSRIRVAIEPVCRRESNILLTYAEGCDMARRVNRESIRCLVDLYHMHVEGEPAEHIVEGAARLQHVHISSPARRTYPRPDDGFDYRPFFDALRRSGYDARISLEAYCDDFDRDAGAALQYLRAL